MNQPAPKKFEPPVTLAVEKPEGETVGLEALAAEPVAAPEKPKRPRDAKGRLLPAADPGAPAQPGSTVAALPPGLPPERPIVGERRQWGERRFNLPKYSRPGFIGRVFNDIPGRLEEAIDRGYTYVRDRDGKPVNLVVDRGAGTRGYLMEIPQAFYDEDFAAKRAINDEIDQAMMRKALSDGGYRPVVHGTNQPVTQASVIRGREPA